MTNCAPPVIVGFEGAVLEDVRFVSAVLGGTRVLSNPVGCNTPDSPVFENVRFDRPAVFSGTRFEEPVSRGTKAEVGDLDGIAA
jgi:hypothetical protein